MNDLDKVFSQVADMIQEARNNAYRKVNEELVRMYWRIGQFLSQQANESKYGDAWIDSLSAYIQMQFPGIKGFNRRGLYRMKQFYETYAEHEKGAVARINWCAPRQ